MRCGRAAHVEGGEALVYLLDAEPVSHVGSGGGASVAKSEARGGHRDRHDDKGSVGPC